MSQSQGALSNPCRLYTHPLLCALWREGASYMGSKVADGLASGNITQAAVDESVSRILTGMFGAGVIVSGLPCNVRREGA